MIHTLTATLDLPLPRGQVFPFFASAENLERITPREVGFVILTPRPIPMELGALIDYRIKLWGVPVHWRTRISAWEPPDRFADEQLRGPYRLWVHEHRFEDIPGGTRITDHVRYQLPLSPVGDIGFPLIRAQLRRIFTYRQERVVAELSGGSGTWRVDV